MSLPPTALNPAAETSPLSGPQPTWEASIDGQPIAWADIQSAADAQRDGPSTPGAPGSTGTADGGAGDGTKTPPSSGMNLWMLVAIGAVIWFLIFAPERKARKQREQMLGELKKGDKVVTTGGLHAQVVEIRENEVVLKAGETRLTYSRSAVHQVVDGSSDKA